MPSVQALRITFGTCIVAIRTPNEIILGADSLRRYGDGCAEVVCKIGREGNIVFAVAGFLGALDDEAQKNLQVNIPEIVGESIRLGFGIADSLGNIKLAIENGLAEYIRGCPNDDQSKVLAGLKDHGIEVVVCGMENDCPNLSAIELKLKSPFEIDFGVQILDNIGVGDEGPVPYFAGFCAKYKAGGVDLSGERVQNVRRLIQMEIMLHEKREKKDRWVGPPIRIVRVDSSGIRWESGDEVCN